MNNSLSIYTDSNFGVSISAINGCGGANIHLPSNCLLEDLLNKLGSEYELGREGKISLSFLNTWNSKRSKIEGHRNETEADKYARAVDIALFYSDSKDKLLGSNANRCLEQIKPIFKEFYVKALAEKPEANSSRKFVMDNLVVPLYVILLDKYNSNSALNITQWILLKMKVYHAPERKLDETSSVGSYSAKLPREHWF